MILDKIVAQKRQEIEEIIKARNSAATAEFLSDVRNSPRGFRKALMEHQGVSLIAEAKKASPSKGIIAPDFDPAQIARQYKAGGAQAISVLTDEHFFQGSLDYIQQVRSAVDLPVLRKDFIIHEVQIEQARKFGADAILLIAAILDRVQIKEYLTYAAELGLDVLVEIHDEHELEKAMDAGSSLIGINNRNLRDFTLDLNTTFRLKKELPPAIPVVSESGIRNNDDILRLEDAGIDAVLVGETLMRATERSQSVKDLMGW